MKKQYETARGKTIDMEALKTKNELVLAVGNVKMNARGDLLGPGGKIAKKREETAAEYYQGPAKSSNYSAHTETATPVNDSVENTVSSMTNKVPEPVSHDSRIEVKKKS